MGRSVRALIAGCAKARQFDVRGVDDDMRWDIGEVKLVTSVQKVSEALGVHNSHG